MQLDVDDLFPLTDAAQLLGFAQVTQGDILLLPAGERFVKGAV
jgi:NitT/TauT family transport system ATP-binding protein